MLEDINIQIAEEAKTDNEGLFKSLFDNSDIKQYARWALYSIKAEITLNEFRFLMYWISLIELGLFLVALVLLLIAAEFWILIHVLHIARPLLAFKVLKALPKSHEIFEELPNLKESKVMQPVIFAHFKRGYTWLSRYIVLSVVCILIDVVGSIMSFSDLNDSSNFRMFYGLVTWVLLCFDFYLIFWYYTLRWMYPDEIWQNIRNAMNSGLYGFESVLKDFIRGVNNRFRRG